MAATVKCTWDICKFNRSGECIRWEVVLETQFVDKFIEVLTCTSFEPATVT